MDRDNGRRRSSRLAAKGVSTTPRAEPIVKKALKSVEKPKRTKRKNTEVAAELPDAKKTKTEEKKLAIAVNVVDAKTNDIEKNDVTPMDQDIEKNDVTPMDQDIVPKIESLQSTEVMQNDVETEVKQNDVETEEKQNYVETEEEQNDVETEEEQNKVEAEVEQTDVEAKVEQIDDATEVKQIDEATEVKQIDDATEVKPNDEATEVEPNDEATEVEPNDEATEVEPNDEATEGEQTDEATEVEPNDVEAKVEPNDVEAKVEKTYEATEVEKNYEATEVEQNDEATEDDINIEAPFMEASELVEVVESIDGDDKEKLAAVANTDNETVSEATIEPVENYELGAIDPSKSFIGILDIDMNRDKVLQVENSLSNFNVEEETKEVADDEMIDEKVNDDINVAKDMTPNGDSNEVKSTNGDEPEAVEQSTNVVHDAIGTDLKAAVTTTTPVANEEANELEKVAENVNVVSPDEKPPNVDQSTTVMS